MHGLPSFRMPAPADIMPTALTDSQLLAQCETDTYRASGPGGQKRNKTSSAVRLRHPERPSVPSSVRVRVRCPGVMRNVWF